MTLLTGCSQRARGAFCGVLLCIGVFAGVASAAPPDVALPQFEPMVMGEDGWPLPMGERWAHVDVVLALSGEPLLSQRIVYCEVGRSGSFNPWAVGGMGEIGPGQLLPGRGNGLSIFYAWGFTDPNSPWQVIRGWLREVSARGMMGSQYPRTSLGCLGSP